MLFCGQDAAVPTEGDQGIEVWKKEMDDAGIDWRFNNHARTPHGFALAPGVFRSGTLFMVLQD